MKIVEILEIRKRIHSAGHNFFETLGKQNHDLQNIAGEFMARNEDYCIRYPETVGYFEIMRSGFTANQKNFLQRISKALKAKGAVCSWCGRMGPAHEGGIVKRNGEEITGLFCDRRCFDNWSSAHALVENRTNIAVTGGE